MELMQFIKIKKRKITLKNRTIRYINCTKFSADRPLIVLYFDLLYTVLRGKEAGRDAARVSTKSIIKFNKKTVESNKLTLIGM